MLNILIILRFRVKWEYLNISKCYFVLCTKSDIHIEVVSWIKFYNHFMLPEIVYPSVKFDLPALDISKF